MDHTVTHIGAIWGVAVLTLAAIALFIPVSCAAEGDDHDKRGPRDKYDSSAQISEHLIAEATLTAHLIHALVESRADTEQVNATLASIVKTTVIDEFWISGPDGAIEYTSHPEIDFTFPTDPDAGTQAAPFAVLLDGVAAVVVQEPMPREFDGKMYQYVAVAGIDSPRIVQVGIQRQDAKQDH